MSVYMITYFISDTTGHSHSHDENCGCGGDHGHSHEKEGCGCGGEHTHSHEPIHGDANLIGKIKSLGAWARFLPEGFFVKTSLTADEIFAEISSVANKGDIIFVTKVDAQTSACANPAVLEWLAK